MAVLRPPIALTAASNVPSAVSPVTIHCQRAKSVKRKACNVLVRVGFDFLRVSPNEVDPLPGPALQGPEQATPLIPCTIRWKNDQPVRSRRKSTKRAAQANATGSSTRVAADIPTSRNQGAIPAEIFDPHQDDSKDIDQYFDRPSNRALLPATGSISPWLALLDSHNGMLMSHSNAEQVAPVLVVLDQVSHGYRDVLLPLACEDGLVQRAVSVVATQHLALYSPFYQSIADRGRAVLISRLGQDSTSPDRVFTTSTWATRIILLVGETITGSSEYGHLLQTLM
ncbi:hypothetical protein N7520_010195 [Penicillium odoratum]|uniref:uncharacterized protein n=1 Tax=Penicillium odoratum TaxID=1167516 RepID=UPI0025484EE9|nr:uncharacterized protein N7520_010195 [Penicillium odoratum]KAJ5753278.1 hypothetical protein N7520_010195 [Penicillium odoratum]